MNFRNIVVLLILLAVVDARTTSGQTPPNPPARDVLVLALDSEESSGDLALIRLALGLFGHGSDQTTIRDVQMDIVRKTGEFGPVMLVAPDEKTRSEVGADCERYRICELLSSGRVRVAVVPHDSVWIRDYGPMVEAKAPGNTVTVTDAVYYDVRQDDRRGSFLHKAADKRMQLISEAMGGSDEGDILQRLKHRPAEEVERELSLWTQYSALLHEQEGLGQRTLDDHSPYPIAQAVLANPRFQFHSTPVSVDGGNMLHLDDGNCLTTKDLFVRNRGKEATLSAELQNAFGCRNTIFLDALPGNGVIEHVDMFALPAGGNKILLADYGLDQPHIKQAWGRMNAVEREMTFQAALVTSRNAATLRAQGYEVISVPAVTPRSSEEDGAYYPTVLNALVRSDGASRLQVLVPFYSGWQEDVQTKARERIANAFGERAQIETVEATVAARAQGAIHCLTITVPYAATVFNDGVDERYRQTSALRQALDDGLIAPTRTHLPGVWNAIQVGPASTSLDALGLTVTFTDANLTWSMRSSSATGAYTVTKDQNLKWKLDVSFPERPKVHGRIEWLTERSFRLILEDTDPIVLSRPLTFADLDPGTRRVRIGADEEGSLGQTDERDASGSPLQAWTLEARAGEAITIDVKSKAFDPEVFVIGPGLTTSLHDDDGGDGHNARLYVEFPATGLYTVVVKGADKNESGNFTIRGTAGRIDDSDVSILRELPTEGRALALGGRSSGEMTPGSAKGPQGQLLQAWTLAACQTATVRIDLQSEDFEPLLFVIGSNLPRSISGGSLSSNEVTFECSPTTSYTVVVVSADQKAGRFTLGATAQP